MTTRYRLTIEYDGRPFVGWQRQENGPSVQAALEEAIARFCGETVTVFAAGRTDAGVHALGQVVHIDIERATTPDEVQGALNYHLKPAPVAVLDVAIAAPEFHARFDATARHYRHRIVNRRAPLTIEAGLAWWVPVPLDMAAMQAGADLLIGRHDFTTFRSVQCQSKSPVKTLDEFTFTQDGEVIEARLKARSFLHHQVRSMIGTLKLVGEGSWQVEDVKRALEARDRSALGLNAPPDGLYLVKVDYDG
jgi:tRNA pseudouridine38-40 synthase